MEVEATRAQQLLSKTCANAKHSRTPQVRETIAGGGADIQQAMLALRARLRRLTFKLTVGREHRLFVKALFKVQAPCAEAAAPPSRTQVLNPPFDQGAALKPTLGEG